MNTKVPVILIVFLSLLYSCSDSDKTVLADYSIVPLPRSVIADKSNSVFTLNKFTKITYASESEEQKKIASFLSDYINESTGIRLAITTDNVNKNAIQLQIVDTSNIAESYHISVTSDLIQIQAGQGHGLFYGIQTLRKSIPAGNTNSISFPVAQIEDYPEFKHRGGHLDVSRHFFSVDFVKKYIDVLAMYNMNVFHWHLTDDQGWRIEIEKYPELTKIGSQRAGTAIDRHSEEYDDKPYGGFYTQEQIKEVVEYARQRYITIIPEIDVPGHTLSVLASYPHLGCTGGPYEVGRGWGIFEDVLCAGNDSVFTFLDDVFTEVAELFPAKYIHIGGDECLKNRWDACPKCQKRMKDLGIKDTKEHTKGEYLQSYFIRRVEEMINQKGKSIIGWDEILEGGIAPNATIMSWRGTEGGVYAAGKGHDVIMTPEAYVYLDYYQSPDVDKEPYTFGWLTDLEKVYSFDLMPRELSKDKQKHILGGQVNVWAEYIPTGDHVEYMLLPRMAAFAETLWSYPSVKDYNGFVSRMYSQSKLLDKLGYKNCKRAYEVQANYDYDTDKHFIKATLSVFDDAPIYYTLDGTEPNEQSLSYTGTINIDKTSTLKAVVYRDGQLSAVYLKEFSFNKATARPIELKYAPDTRYTFNGAITLVDGQKGYIESYRTGFWLGFLGENMEAVIKLDSNTEVSSVSVNMFVNTRGNLMLPKSVKIFLSDDGNSFKEVFSKGYPEYTEHKKPVVSTLEASFKEQKANYVKVIFENPKTLPDWHEKKGAKPYLMVDEIMVN